MTFCAVRHQAIIWTNVDQVNCIKLTVSVALMVTPEVQEIISLRMLAHFKRFFGKQCTLDFTQNSWYEFAI